VAEVEKLLDVVAEPGRSPRTAVTIMKLVSGDLCREWDVDARLRLSVDARYRVVLALIIDGTLRLVPHPSGNGTALRCDERSLGERQTKLGAAWRHFDFHVDEV
jgi:hypothetical protein